MNIRTLVCKHLNHILKEAEAGWSNAMQLRSVHAGAELEGSSPIIDLSCPALVIPVVYKCLPEKPMPPKGINGVLAFSLRHR